MTAIGNMEATASFSNRHAVRVVTTASAPVFSGPTSGLDQDTPRFLGGKLSPTALQSTRYNGNSSPQKTYSNGYLFYPQQQEKSEQRPGPSKPLTFFNGNHTASRVFPETSSHALYEATTTTAPSVAQASSPTCSTAYSSSLAAAATAKPSQLEQETLDHPQTLEQMNVALNHQVATTFGGHASGHPSLTRSPTLNHSPLSHGGHYARPPPQMSHQSHWNSGRPMYSEPGPYDQRNSQSPTTAEGHYTTQNASAIQSSLPGSSDSYGSVDGLGGLPGSSGHHHQPPQHQLGMSSAPMQSTLLTPTHSSMPHQGHLFRQDSSNNNDSSNTASMMGYHHQPPSGVAVSAGYPPKPSPVGALQSHSPFQMYHQQSLHPQHMDQHQQQASAAQHTQLATSEAGGGIGGDNSMRLIPPLPSQPGLSSMAPTMSYPPGMGNRGYAYNQSPQGPMGGPVISNMGNPGGHMTLVSNTGLAYGQGHKPLLYSNTHPIHPHLNPNQLGSHQTIGKGPPSAHERPFKCDQCPQSFNRNHDLKRHKRIHLAVKPFPCNFCDKSFSRKDALKRHRLVKGCGEKLEASEMNATAGMGPGGITIDAGSKNRAR